MVIQKIKSSSSEPPANPSSRNFASNPAACTHLECQLRRRFLAFSLVLSVPPRLAVEGIGQFSSECQPQGVRLGALLPPVGGAEDLRPPPRLPLPLKPPGLAPPAPGFTTLTSVPTPLLFSFLMFFGFAAFYVAFIFIMPLFAAISACYRAAEMVLLLHLLTISGFLRAVQLQHARTSPITVGRLAGSTLIVRRTTVEKIRGPFTL